VEPGLNEKEEDLKREARQLVDAKKNVPEPGKKKK